jgi:hypothetical protein
MFSSHLYVCHILSGDSFVYPLVLLAWLNFRRDTRSRRRLEFVEGTFILAMHDKIHYTAVA